MLLEIQISSSLLLTSANKRRTFFTNRVLFRIIFFPKSYLKVLGEAYARVRLIHESLRYLIRYPKVHVFFVCSTLSIINSNNLHGLEVIINAN